MKLIKNERTFIMPGGSETGKTLLAVAPHPPAPSPQGEGEEEMIGAAFMIPARSC